MFGIGEVVQAQKALIETQKEIIRIQGELIDLYKKDEARMTGIIESQAKLIETHEKLDALREEQVRALHTFGFISSGL